MSYYCWRREKEIGELLTWFIGFAARERTRGDRQAGRRSVTRV